MQMFSESLLCVQAQAVPEGLCVLLHLRHIIVVVMKRLFLQASFHTLVHIYSCSYREISTWTLVVHENVLQTKPLVFGMELKYENDPL